MRLTVFEVVTNDQHDVRLVLDDGDLRRGVEFRSSVEEAILENAKRKRGWLSEMLRLRRKRKKFLSAHLRHTSIRIDDENVLSTARTESKSAREKSAFSFPLLLFLPAPLPTLPPDTTLVLSELTS